MSPRSASTLTFLDYEPDWQDIFGTLRNDLSGLAPAGQFAGLLHPSGELSFIELVVLVDVQVARVLALGLAGGDRTQRRAAEESHFDVVREGMDAEEPALALDSIQRRVPFDLT